MKYWQNLKRIIANITFILVVSAGLVRLFGPFMTHDIYTFFVPSMVKVVYARDTPTVGSIIWGINLTAAQILLLACATLWVRRWAGWRAYMFRLMRFICFVALSVMVVLGIGLVHRNQPLEVYGPYYNIAPHELPVVKTLFAVFACTLFITIVWWFIVNRKWLQETEPRN
jgi:hypothetical protein